MADDRLEALRNAVYLLKQAQARLAAQERAQSEPIAVIGMACRFPGDVQTPDQFWRLLRDGTDAIEEVPPDRWNIDDYYDPDPAAPAKMNTRWGGFIRRAGEFDAEFFGISPREAVRADPQQRLLLEVCWEALEDAALPADDLSRTRAGVYAGVIGNDYALMLSRNLADLDIFSGTGSSHAIISNRVSYVLNLTGPSVTLDTACSSSLVAVHLACHSLRRRESDLALAGGVNLILGPDLTLALTKAHMMAPDGRCKTFDASADGYVRGEGCGVVVLKRLGEAVSDRDRILAVIRGSAVNHDGRSNGLSAPNGPAQEAVIRAALADARLQPADLDYIEAHGTGTRLGDPIEIEALRTVLGADRPADRPLVVGSVKTNIGHLESAAGIAGLIKVILMLRHGQIPPHLHLSKVNPLLKIEGSFLSIPTEHRDWPRGARPRRAGVSSFGFGGTNAHVVVEEPPAGPDRETGPGCPLHLFTLSARSAGALSELAGRHADHAGSDPGADLGDLAATSSAGRSHFSHRAVVTAGSVDDLAARLRALQAGRSSAGLATGTVDRDRPPAVAFLFTGQGSQYAGMGLGLYRTHPVFREAIDRCAAALDPHLERGLLSLLEPEAGPLLDRTGHTQPVLFALEYALATLWRSWGVEPSVVMGHSVGELAAACFAGVFSLEDGLRLIAARARSMQSLPAGGLMAAVFASADQVAAELAADAGRVAIAALNGPASTVVSGEEEAVRLTLARLSGRGLGSKVLSTSHAFHSHLMDPILDDLRRVAATIPMRPPSIPIVSNRTGTVAQPTTFSAPDYWDRHAREPVRFADGVQTLDGRDCEVYLEIGPSPTLIGMAPRCLPAGDRAWLPSLRPGRDDWQTMLESVTQLYLRGVRIDWAAFHGPFPWRKRSLPTYPFQRKLFWLSTEAREAVRDEHPLVGRRLALATSEIVFEARVTSGRPALLADHRVQGSVMMPGSAYLEMALAASAEVFGAPWIVRGTSFLTPLVLDATPRTLQTIVAPEGTGAASYRIASLDGSGVTLHAMGRLEAPAAPGPEAIDVAATRARFTAEPRDEAWQTEALRRSGLEPGPTFRWIRRHWPGEREALCEMRAPVAGDRADPHAIHPGLVDCLFQLLGVTLPGAGTGIDAHVPMTIDRLELRRRPTGSSLGVATLVTLETGGAAGHVRLVDESGEVLLAMDGVGLRRVPRDWLTRLTSGPLPDWLLEPVWVVSERAAPAGSPGSPGEDDRSEGPPRPAGEPARWLFLDSRDGVGAATARFLEAQAHRCTVVPAGLDPAARRDAVSDFLATGGPESRQIVLLGALDACDHGRSPDLATARDHGWGAALDVIQASGQGAPRLWLVTRGALAAGERPQPLSLGQAPVWGLGRVVAAEHPELACTRVDLDPADRPASAGQLAAELLLEGQPSAPREDEIAYREARRFVARLRPLKRGGGKLEPPAGRPYRLDIVARGQLDDVTLAPSTRPRPARGQVEIRVRATGMNFRDVLNVLGLYPGDPGPLGGECAGEIVAVGPGVERFRPGDAVVALAPASFASFVVTPEEFVAPKPAALSFEEAATIPICFLTAHLALDRLARLAAGERVLIHAASGGVGLAAIQIARRAGARIFATAGNPGKRARLQAMGIEHVFDSRSPDFARAILEATDGEGVDVVLNSLTGELIAASLSLLGPGGRFMELGKTDLWDQGRVDATRPGVAFHAIALDTMMAESPEVVGELIREVLPLFDAGALEPLPHRVFPITGTVEALRFMARAEHIGKIVIRAVADDDRDSTVSLRTDATYLITGGLGGLGLEVARWLADRGARNLALVGRSAPSDEARAAIRTLEERQVRVLVRSCDVESREEVAGLLEAVERELPPIRGVFHLAGVLDDGILREQTRERFDRVMAPKVAGAWNLHELTGSRLDLFVLFSSAASLLGSPGQGNYAAANAFLDALAHQRRFEGLPALAVNWGSWADVGMAARLNQTEGRRLAAAGMGWIDPARGVQTLERLLVDDRVQAGVLAVDWQKFFARIPPGSEPARLGDLARQARSARAGDSGPPALLEKLRAVTAGERLDLAVSHIRQEAARVLAMGDADLPDPRRTLNELGFDSLTGVELCNRVGRSIGQHLNPTVLFDHPTLEGLAEHVVRDVLRMASAPVQQPPSADERSRVLDDVEQMSEDEMDALVMKQLEKLNP